MGVIMQAFYWDCPRQEQREYDWWTAIKERIESLAQTGFTALWLPPHAKAAQSASMGYDVYDYYDLGEFDQKGDKRTWFGTKQDLIDLIRTAHEHGLSVYADVVLNHNSGGDAQEKNPIDGEMRWTKFTPASQKFPRSWDCFHPSPYESWDQGTFGDMPDLCHRNPYVYDAVLKNASWLVDEIGFDGFRYDCVKGYGGWMVKAIQELRLRGGAFKPFGVGECWDSDRLIEDWLNEANSWSDNPTSAFDFPLRYRLRDLCNNPHFSLRELVQGGTVTADRPFQSVTFVENHDVERDDPVIFDKILAYAYILTHEGYPCVFWRDYYDYHLGRENEPDGIAALVQAHEDYAGGGTDVLYVDDSLYIMQRRGWGNRTGLVFVLNKSGGWNGRWVATQWQNKKWVPVAWSGGLQPIDKYTNTWGWADFWAPPLGYAVYVPR